MRLIDEIFKKTQSERSFTSIAKEVNLSVSTVIRFFGMPGFNPPPKLPEVLSVDEFKGNTNKEKLLTMKKSKLKPEQSEKVEYLLYFNDDLRSAYYLKELFYEILDCDDGNKGKQLLSQWILTAQNTRLKEYRNCSVTLQNWSKSILNTFDYPYTNGFTEGCNNKIKVLKRNAYGYRNFNRFRKRILHMFNYKKSNNGKTIA